jgi:hypothetical protein
MTWTDAKLRELARLWQRGDSASEIGRQISKTKNAVIGMARRQGLPPRESPIRPRKPAAPTPMPPKLHDGKATFVAARPLKLAKPTKSTRSCLFPMWPDGADPTHEYCGKRVQPGSSYCKQHHAICYHVPKWTMSDEARAKISAAARRRWAKRKAA